MKNGIYFWIGQKDYFVVTDQRNRTVPFAIRVLKALHLPPTNANAKELARRMLRAELFYYETKNGIRWYDICGDRFSYGDRVDSGKLVTLALN